MIEVGNNQRAKWAWAVAAAIVLATGCTGAAARGAEGGAATPPRAESQPTDKSGYSLFNPVPASLLRDLSPDRPDTTESPYTVDAGHVQAEVSFAEWGKGDGAEQLSVLPFNLKVGLTNFADVQFVFGPYDRLRTVGRTDQGASDAEIRLKWNVWGNDGGNTALAVMPFISLPTGADAFSAGAAEGGIIVPLALTLPAGFGLTTMAEFDFVRDGTGGRDTLFVHTASLDHDVTEKLGAYIEYAGVVDLDGDQKYQAYADVGFTYGMTDNLQFDAGVNVGLTTPAENLRIFAGMTIRL